MKSALFKVCSIACYTFFPSFGQFVNTTPVKIFPLLLQTIHRAIFSHLRTNQSATQQMRDPSIQTSGNLKESSLVTKPHWVETS